VKESEFVVRDPAKNLSWLRDRVRKAAGKEIKYLATKNYLPNMILESAYMCLYFAFGMYKCGFL